MKIEKSEPKTPSDLKKILDEKPLVEAVWNGLTSLARWDFIIYINQAKQVETRKHRIEKTISLLTAGKRRPCCFTIVPMDLYKQFDTNPKAKAAWGKLGPVERRNFVTWIDSSTNKNRIGQACVLLASGKQQP